MGVWEEHNMTRYSDYFDTPWWRRLKSKYIFKNFRAKCFVCNAPNRLRWMENERREVSNLLLHHVSYKNLFKEKVNEDFFIICFHCHNRAHYWTFLNLKVPLKTNWLLFSLRLRKSIKCIRNKEFGLFLLWFSVAWILGIYHALFYILKNLLLFSLSVLKIFLQDLGHILTIAFAK
jgi:hypothetical protein